ncbi:MAG: hypothetical protein QGD90_12960 [Candidatus Hydrogenedentes bacterium]|nr:hypothetical protein [Candidatus Hydrogenedentota bacterium]
MLFRKRKSQDGKWRKFSKEDESAPQPEKLMRLEFQMMLRGNVIERPSGKVRQIGVTVEGSTKVVTSGDLIDRETYEALIRAGAIQPKAPPKVPPKENSGS